MNKMQISVMKNRGIRNIRFPFVYKKLNNSSGRNDILRVEILTTANIQKQKALVNEWVSYLNKHPVSNIGSTYFGNIDFLNKFKYPMQKKDVFPLIDPQTYFYMTVSSKSGVEALAAMTLSNNGMASYLDFIGLAPWNMKDNGNMPRYRGLSYDLMELSMALSLKAAENLSDSAPILKLVFSTKRAIDFARGVFGYNGDNNGKNLFVELNKRGVEAYFRKDMEQFSNNASYRLLPFEVN